MSKTFLDARREHLEVLDGLYRELRVVLERSVPNGVIFGEVSGAHEAAIAELQYRCQRIMRLSKSESEAQK
jgi:hypothetical protein